MGVFFFPVMAVSAIANIVKSSLGPVGLDKMLVDDVGVSELWRVISCSIICYSPLVGHKSCAMLARSYEL